MKKKNGHDAKKQHQYSAFHLVCLFNPATVFFSLHLHQFALLFCAGSQSFIRNQSNIQPTLFLFFFFYFSFFFFFFEGSLAELKAEEKVGCQRKRKKKNLPTQRNGRSSSTTTFLKACQRLRDNDPSLTSLNLDPISSSSFHKANS